MANYILIFVKVVIGFFTALIFLSFAVLTSVLIGRQDYINSLHAKQEGILKRMMMSFARVSFVSVSLFCVPLCLTWAGIDERTFWIGSSLSLVIILIVGGVTCLFFESASLNSESVPFNIYDNNSH